MSLRDKAVRMAFFFALMAWTLVAGKDVSWDVVNHHLYLPFAWLDGRAHTDLFAAGAQSYQNPVGYLPAYALIRSGLPDWIVGVVLAAAGALVVWPLDRIARLAWPADQGADPWWRLVAMALCCSAPILLILVGTTSVDPVTGVTVVWALALSLESGNEAARAPLSLGLVGLAGLLAGLASAVKLSNAPFAVVLGALWLLKWLVGQADARRVLAFCAGAVLSFAVFAGPWMGGLWRDFGNPVYPLFNNVFHSPYAPQQAVTSLRFVPSSAWEMVSRLWDMGTFNSFVSFEKFTPDVRPLALAIASVLAAGTLAARGGWRRLAARPAWRAPMVQLALVTAVAYVLWMRSSGNARYALPLLVVIGIPLVRAVQRALPVRHAGIVLLAVLLLQSTLYFPAGDRRLAAVDWDGGPYIDFKVPPRLREQSFLHLSIGVQSNAALALWLAPGGAFASPLGEFTLPADGPLGERLRALMDRWHGRTRVLFNAPDAVDPADVAHMRQATRAWLYPLGLDVDWSDCDDIQLVASRHEDRAWATNGGRHADRERDLRSCGVLYRSDRDSAADAQLLVANRVFAILEAACPRVFAPAPLASQRNIDTWQRHYLNTDAELKISPHDGVTFSHFRSMTNQSFGSIDDVLQGKNPLRCPKIEYQTPR